MKEEHFNSRIECLFGSNLYSIFSINDIYFKMMDRHYGYLKNKLIEKHQVMLDSF